MPLRLDPHLPGIFKLLISISWHSGVVKNNLDVAIYAAISIFNL